MSPTRGAEASRTWSTTAPQRSAEGYRVLWYRSSQKQEQDRQQRHKRPERARARLEE